MGGEGGWMLGRKESRKQGKLVKDHQDSSHIWIKAFWAQRPPGGTKTSMKKIRNYFSKIIYFGYIPVLF